MPSRRSTRVRVPRGRRPRARARRPRRRRDARSRGDDAQPRPLRVSGSAGAGRHRRVSAHRVDVAVFSLALAVFGLVALALVWSGDWAYALLARATGNTEAIIVVEVFP